MMLQIRNHLSMLINGLVGLENIKKLEAKDVYIT